MPGLFLYLLMTHFAGAIVLACMVAALLMIREETDSYVWSSAFCVVGALSYAVASYALGGLSDRLGRRPVAAGGMAIVGISTAIVVAWPTLAATMVYSVLSGVGLALFFTSIEGYVADRMRRGADIIRGASVYNISWCSGDVVGTLIGAWLVGVSPRLPFGVATGMALFCVAAIAWDARRKDGESPATVADEDSDVETDGRVRTPAVPGTDAGEDAGEAPAVHGVGQVSNLPGLASGSGTGRDGRTDRANSGTAGDSWALRPDRAALFALAGRVGLFFGASACFLALATFPKYAVDRGVSPEMAGTAVAVMLAVEVVVFYLMGRVQGWRGKSGMQVAMNAIMALGCLVVAAGRGAPVLTLGMALLGVGYACTYTFSLAYSLSLGSGEHSKEGGVHEAAIGLGNALGPLLAAAVAVLTTDDRFLFVVGAALVAISVVGQTVLFGRKGAVRAARECAAD